MSRAARRLTCPVGRGLLLAVLAVGVSAGTLAAQQAADPAGAGAAQEARVGTDAGPGSPAADTLTLQSALQTALDARPSVDAARADASAERAARWADWGAFLPTASADASFGRSRFTTVTFQDPEGTADALADPLTGERHFVTQGLSFRWDLLRGGRRFAELDAGASAAVAAERRLSVVERTAVAEVKAAYFEAVKQQRLAAIAEEQLESRRRELERTRRRFRLAAVSRTDLLGAEGQVRSAEIQLLDARRAAREARRQLAVEMGRSGRLEEGTALADPPAAPDPGALDADSLVERALTSHPEIAALTAEADAASARLWGERSSYLPTISLGYSTSRSEQLGPGGSFLNFDPRNTSRGLSLTASWELFGGFDRRERTARADATLERRRAERSRRRIEIEKAVRDAVAEVRRRDRRLELLRAQRELARERLRLTEEAFRTGSVGFVELQSAVEELTAAERGVVVERYDVLAAWARLELWGRDLRSGT